MKYYQELFIIISMFCGIISAFFSLVRQYQMFQQNSYFPSRYFKWLKSSYSVDAAASAVVFCISSVLYSCGYYIFQAIVLALLLGWRIANCISVYRSSVKKIVFTSRIIRLFISTLIIESVPAVIYMSQFGRSITVGYENFCSIMLIVSILISTLSPILVFLSWGLSYPLEKIISNWFIYDARQKLENSPELKVIGITGSYGKTTTKFILTRMLSEKYNTVCTPQSFNTTMGVVRTIREKLTPATEIFVCEMGAKKPNDIKEICDIVNPDFGIITAVGEQHLETFITIDNVYKTKFELADAVIKNKGVCLLNHDSEKIAEKAQSGDNIVFYGANTNYRAENITYSKKGSEFDLILGSKSIRVSTMLLGKHSVSDIIAAAAMADMLGVDINDIAFAISSLKPTEHRLELKQFSNGSLIIDDAYNSNPEGCIEAVAVLSCFKGMKKTIITPGLIELGEKEHTYNYNFGLACAKVCDTIILVGSRYSAPIKEAVLSTEFDTESLYCTNSFAEALEIFGPTADENSVCLLENDLPDNYLSESKSKH